MGKLLKEEINSLIEKAYNGRIKILKMMKNGDTHIGGAFSCIDILTVLYNKILRHDPENPEWKDRDRFILSAGHKGIALYPVLQDQGYFTEEILWTYNKFNSSVPMHPDRVLPGIEFPTGSLGHGLSVGNGFAIIGKSDKKNFRVFVLLGDGECGEGSIWEAIMASAHYKLDNLTVIVDRNGLQVNGKTTEVMNTAPLEDKFTSFGWEVRTIDGHDFNQINNVLLEAPFKKGRPSCIIADTIKCKGFPDGENIFSFHHWHCDNDKINEVISDIEKAKRSELQNID
jgi:transketolase